jgi:hypothetical protein
MPAVLLLIALVFAAASAAGVPPSRSPAQPQRIRLAQGQSSAILQGRFEPGAEGVDYWQKYVVAAKSGQRLKVRLTSADPGAWLAVYFAHGVVPVAQGTAKLAPTEKCTPTMHLRPNRLSIEQQGSDDDCRFGFGVTAAGDYRRTSLCAEPQLDVP